MTLHNIFDTSKKEKRQKGEQPTTFYCHSDIATRVALVHNFFITFQSNQVQLYMTLHYIFDTSKKRKKTKS